VALRISRGKLGGQDFEVLESFKGQIWRASLRISWAFWTACLDFLSAGKRICLHAGVMNWWVKLNESADLPSRLGDELVG